MEVLRALVLLLYIVQLTSCMEQPIREEPKISPDQFFKDWIDNNGVFYLSEKQASWWYSLGEYRPRQREYEELQYPRRYDYAGQYEYPPYKPGGGTGGADCEEIPGPMRRRYEFREMTSDMRQQYVDAVMALASYIPDPVTAPTTSGYDVFVGLHQSLQSPGAHGGASFLPFHREYLWRFENALILHGNYPSNLGLPIWDSILDSGLPNPSQSVMWTAQFMGNNQGDLGAPFAGLSVPDFCSGKVERNVPSGGAAHYLFDEDVVTNLMAQSCFAHLTQNSAWDCWGNACNFEGRHGGPHIWFGFGSDMSNYCSPSDPIFWLHHGFIDCMWEDFRNNAQVSHLEKEYPQSSFGGAPFAWDASMAPFEGLINAHGLSTHYTTYYYDCSPRLSGIACYNHNDCNPLNDSNPALYCLYGKCQSKIRQGGSCSGLPHNACWCASGSPRCSIPRGGTNAQCSCLYRIDAVDAVLQPVLG